MKALLKQSIVILCLFFFSNSSFSQIDYKGFPEWSIESEGITYYALYTPSNIIPGPGNLYPIALFMHGCCGVDDTARLRNAVDPPVRMWHNFGQNTQSIPTYIISPASSGGWSHHFNNLITVINDLIANHQGDPKRVYVTGFSMGGGGTWDIINQNPTYFAAALPMGMAFRGSYSTIKDIPIWTNRGSDGGWSTNLESQVAGIRAVNGDNRGGEQWVTGVNARFTEFEGVGHGVQWDACGSQDLVGWALTKINDGNVYPVVFFNSPAYKQVYNRWDDIILDIEAEDPDGTITKVETYVNGILSSTLTSSPYLDTILIHRGDNKIEAIAYDNGGKTSTATIIVRTNNFPSFTTSELPNAKQGALYTKQLFANGNAPFTFRISDKNDALPEGLTLSENGLIKGVPLTTGNYTIRTVVADENNDSIARIYSLQVLAKNTDEVIITNTTLTTVGETVISKMRKHELPTAHSGTEVNISDIGVYTGLTYIAVPASDYVNTDNNYLSFDVDEDVTVQIAYEVKNLQYSSTIPTWLSTYTKETDNEIVAQYRYFEIYSKDFPQGTVTLSGADGSNNNIEMNYMVMVKKTGTTLNTTPTITTTNLHDGYPKYLYTEQLTAIDGEGILTWTLTSGSLPYGFELSSDGIISGPADTTGTYNFDIEVQDEDGDTQTASLSLTITSSIPPQAINLNIKDTVILMNSALITCVFYDVSNNSPSAQDIEITSYTDDSSLLTVSSPLKINDTTFSISYSPVLDQLGVANIHFVVTDNNNIDTLTNVTYISFEVRVLEFINIAPNCDAINNQTVGLNNKYLQHQLEVTGINDGNNGSQYIFASIRSTSTDIIKLLDVSSIDAEGTAVISFNPWELGQVTITFTIQDDGGTDFSGVDTKVITFQINVVDSAGYIGPDIIDGVELLEMEGFKIYPNPSSQFINISPPNKDSYHVSLYSMTGKLVFEDDNCKSIPVYSFTPGLYYISIRNQGEVIGKEKVIIQ